MKYLFNILILALTSSFVFTGKDDSNPGVRFTFSQIGIKAFESEFLPDLIKNTKFKLEDIFINQHLDFLGTININMTDCQLSFNDIGEDNIQVTFVEDSFVNINISNFTGIVDFNYTFKSGFYTNVSPGFLNISNIGINSTNKIYAQQNLLELNKLSPGLEITKLEMDSMKVDLSFKNMGHVEQLLKYILDNIQDIFVNMIKEKVTEIIPRANFYINLMLANASLHSEIEGTNLTIDYTLSDNPKVTGDILEVNFNTSVSSKVNNFTYDGPSMPIPHIKTTTAPLDGFINQYVFDSYAYVLYKENQTNFPINSPLITTFTLAMAIPQLFEFYNKETKQVNLNLVANQIPQLKLGENYTAIALDYNTDFIVVVNETYSEVAFNADVAVLFNLTLIMRQNTIKAKINQIKINNFKIKQSNIETIDDKDLATKLNGIITSFKPILENKISKILAGIKIPNIYGVSFRDTEIISHEGYAQFAISPHFEQSVKIAKSSTNYKAMVVNTLIDYPITEPNFNAKVITDNSISEPKSSLNFLE